MSTMRAQSARPLRQGRAIAALGMLVVATACSDDPIAPAAPNPDFRAEVNVLFEGWFQLNPPPGGLFNVCTGENVIVGGEYHLKVQQVVASSGRTTYRVHSQVNIKGTGVTSGREYVAMEVLNQTMSTGPDGAQVLHLEYPLRTISKGSADNGAGRIRIHTTFNPAGELTSSNEEFAFDECGG